MCRNWIFDSISCPFQQSHISQISDKLQNSGNKFIRDRRIFLQQLVISSLLILQLDKRHLNFFRFKEESQKSTYLVLWNKTKCSCGHLGRKSTCRNRSNVWILNSCEIVVSYFI
ncbi:unnamed protein product [Moneuplotes crassus]|uniref:Uncharacterized protein n=1 Tax=Euplotes crassus TaxID=5936 RepID=A0AAD1XTD6_EUPCR|nr:unnamed protein product [Moneuplotes crassus]